MQVKQNLPRLAYVSSSALALSHVVFCFWVLGRHFEGSWGGFLIFLVDLPASVLALLISNIFGIRTDYVLLVVGTAWWFGVGTLLSMLLTWLSAKARKNPKTV